LRWTIGKKIAGGFLLVLVQALLVGLFGLWTTNRNANRLKVLAAEYLP
jgi:CHASE3 domain sensor protein